MPSKSVLIAQAFSEKGVLSTVTDSAPSVNTGQIDVATAASLPATGNTAGDQAFVADTNKLFVWSGAGWYNIAIVNESPTWDSGGQPGASFVLDPDSPQDATIITLSASDPEGFPISYSYETGGSMDSIATISQDSSVFTITPKTSTQVPDGGTGSITFRATDGVNILPAVSSFSLTFITTIANSKDTTLLVNAIAASDNDPHDSSSNNTTLNISGQAYSGAFSPYRHAGYSAYFTGSAGDRLTVSNQASNWSDTGTATIEFWFHSTRTPSTDDGDGLGAFWGDPQSVTIARFDIETSSNDLEFRSWSDAAGNGLETVTIKSALTPNNWYHLAAVNNGQVWKFYVNGVLEHTHTQSTTYNWGSYASGNYHNHVIGQTRNAVSFQGYMTDIRVSSNEVYTSAFTPSTQRLTADSNTTFLYGGTSHMSDTHSSTASNNESITVGGEAGVRPYTPYDNDAYDVSVNGGSVYIDGGASDYISTTGNSSIWSDSGTNTIEFWFYNFRTPTFNGGSSELQDDGICLLWTYAIEIQCAARFGIETTSRDLEFRSWSNVGGGGLQTVTIESNTALNTWYHVAAVRNGQTWKFYINGKLTTTHTQSTNYTWNNTSGGNYDGFWIGKAVGGTSYKGLLSDFWVSNTEKYTADFDVPTAQLSSTNAHLHIKGSEASVIDKTQNSTVRLRGSALGASSPVKFSNTYSMYFPGVGSWMPLPTQTETKLSGTEDWTVEAWVYPTSRQSYSVVMSCGSSFALALGMVSGNFHVYNNSAGGFTDTDVNYGTYDIAANQWTHLAATRVNGNWYCYVDGTLRYQKTGGSWQSHVMNTTSRYTVGALDGYSSFVGNERWFGNIQDVRITKGLARYTTNFTPPTEPLEG